MKPIVCILIVLATFRLSAQNFEDTWSDFFSYVTVKDIVVGNDRVYAASTNAVFSYDLSTQEITTLSTVNGLAGDQISTLYYSQNFNVLLIGYENGLIEVVMDGEEDVFTVVDILDKPSIPPDRKRINQFNEYNGLAYISTEYGISVFDLAALEFGDSYFIGPLGSQINIAQTAVVEPFIYAASTDGGIYQAEVANDDLIDFEEWTPLQSSAYKGAQEIGGQLYLLRSNDAVFRYAPGTGFEQVGSFSTVVDFEATEEALSITTNRGVQAFDLNFQTLGATTSFPDFEPYELISGIAFNNFFYVGTQFQGMIRAPFSGSGTEQILPDGPILNTPFALDVTPGQVWVVFGEVSVTFNPFPLTFRGVSNLVEDTWTNLEVEEVFNANDLVRVAINPENTSEVYMSSFQKGLVKIQEQTPSVLFNETNSPLELAFDDPDAGIRLFGASYDNQGNLWVTQSRVNDGLIRVGPGDSFTKIDVSAIITGEDELAFTEVKVNDQGLVFFGTAQSGLIGYNPDTGAFNSISEGTGSGNLPSPNIRALQFDNSGRLWIGTLEGLRVLFNVGGFFEEGANTDAQEIIILEDGVPQELLFQQSITDIEVDGSNNKWIATATSGVFYLSSDGQETLLRFTKDNSPLPSDNVQDIDIDNFTGRVYFATANGLVAYDGTATAPRDNLENVYAFPNPVRPGFTGNVTIDGLTSNANVKITDIEGNLVFETTSEGGSVLWDTTAFGEYRVASGVYLVLISTDDGIETTVSKIMVVR
ncbi:type IX secretion system anionic LPS delivery protein PorZ [Altibacter sp. HG106]|uniref:type IX secretion system anionic LPS delivery protein PorZ n=1 Tax=Altibacter sp. HG106 TaxID=3023937 RepID=UPI0023505066|nr:T9SS type A sorting domain-containing protein [Altibacter sp. HG106]MDC7994835.1 two-component regulator propeller domain-containing protein [Altibacter sp. HG106]